MQLFIKKQIGKTPFTFVVEGKNLFEVQMEAQKLSFYDVYKCGVCGSDSLRLHAYVTKEEKFEYLKVVCNKCKAGLTFGQVKKSPDTFYLRKNDLTKALDWIAYEDSSQKDTGFGKSPVEPRKDSPYTAPEDLQVDNNDELPF